MVQKDSKITAFTSLMLMLEIVATLGIGLIVLIEVSFIKIGMFFNNQMSLLRMKQKDQITFLLPSAQQATLLLL